MPDTFRPTPPQPDDLPGLDAFVDDARDVSMLDPSEVRRRGTARRVRRRVISGVAAVLVLVLGGGVIATQTGLFDQREPNIARPPSVASPSPTSASSTGPTISGRTPTLSPPSASPVGTASPTTSSSESTASASSSSSTVQDPSASQTGTGSPHGLPPPVSTANLPTVQMLYGSWAGSDAVQVETHAGWGQDAMGMCMQGLIDTAQHVQTRVYSTGGEGLQGKAIVMDFATVEQATAARQQIAAWYQDCHRWSQQQTVKTAGPASNEPIPVSLDAQGSSTALVATAHRTHTLGSDGTGIFEDALVVQAGTRLVWAATFVFGQDNNCATLPDDVAGQCDFYASTKAIAQRLISNG